MPDQVGLLGQFDLADSFCRLGRIEQTQLDARGVFGIEGDVDAPPIPGGAQRIRSARPDAHHHRSVKCSEKESAVNV